MVKLAITLFMIVGICYFSISNYFNVVKIIRA